MIKVNAEYFSCVYENGHKEWMRTDYGKLMDGQNPDIQSLVKTSVYGFLKPKDSVVMFKSRHMRMATTAILARGSATENPDQVIKELSETEVKILLKIMSSIGEDEKETKDAKLRSREQD